MLTDTINEVFADFNNSVASELSELEELVSLMRDLVVEQNRALSLLVGVVEDHKYELPSRITTQLVNIMNMYNDVVSFRSETHPVSDITNGSIEDVEDVEDVEEGDEND